MSIYECHICGEEFESDWEWARLDPTYCESCRSFPETGKAIVYGLYADGPIRYIGSTTNPVSRLSGYRSGGPNSPRQLQEWIKSVGPKNIRMKIIAVTSKEYSRKAEQRAILKHGGRLLNIRAASKNALSKAEIRAILDAALD